MGGKKEEGPPVYCAPQKVKSLYEVDIEINLLMDLSVSKVSAKHCPSRLINQSRDKEIQESKDSKRDLYIFPVVRARIRRNPSIIDRSSLED